MSTDYPTQPSNSATPGKSFLDRVGSIIESISDFLGPKHDLYVNFLKENKDNVGSEVSLVFSGKFGWAGAGLAIAAGLALWGALQATTQYTIDLPIIDYTMEKTWLFFRNTVNSGALLFNCAEAICDFINFAARKKVARMIRKEAVSRETTERFGLITCADQIDRGANRKLFFWDLPQTIILLGLSGIFNTPDQRLIINGANMGLELFEWHKFGSSVFYYMKSLARSKHGASVLGAMILVALMSTFNNLVNDTNKLSRNSIILNHDTLKRELYFDPSKNLYQRPRTSVKSTDQEAFRKVLHLDFSKAKIIAVNQKYINGKTRKIYDIRMSGGYDEQLGMHIGTKYHRLISQKGRSNKDGLDAIGPVYGCNIAQDNRELHEATWAFDWLFDGIGLSEPDYSSWVFTPKQEWEELVNPK